MSTGETEVGEPDLIRVQRGTGDGWRPARSSGVSIVTDRTGAGLSVRVSAGAADPDVSRVHLRWRRPLVDRSPIEATPAARPRHLILGDAWERSYGDLQWRGLQPERVLPWTVLVHDQVTQTTWGAGVEVRGGAFASWTVDPEGVSLWLDLRSGGGPTRLGDRSLTAAVVRFVEGDDEPYLVQCALSAVLCRDPLPCPPLVGANNWYYAYGRDFDAAAVVRDATLIAELVGDHPVRPFGTIDDGWSPDGTADGRPASGGPWDRGRAPEFPVMAEAAAAIAATGVRPGIWFRPLLSREDPGPEAGRPWQGGYALDPSHPGTLQRVASDVDRLRGWGFELIKHDFSTFEALGQWGPTMTARPSAPEIAPHDRSRTSAEVLVDFYRTVHEAAGDAIVLGCNVIGHLAAGLVQAQRTGDDTSGRVWERTRRMGVNTLAFRLAQHRRFFTLDADCVPSTPQTPWALNRQFLELIAHSGTALFVSIDPATRTDAVDADLSAALRLALDGGSPGGIEPLDWLQTSTPQHWRVDAQTREFRWYDDGGADPLDLTDAPDEVD